MPDDNGPTETSDSVIPGGTPDGYEPVIVAAPVVPGDGRVLFACARCTAVVTDADAHTAWHGTVAERIAATARRPGQ